MYRAMTLVPMLVFILSGPMAFAGERVKHFKGEPSTTIEEARANLSEYHRRMAGILARDSLSPKDMMEIHQITYTLENALKYIADELKRLQEELEKIHLASERNDSATIRAVAPNYLSDSGRLFD